MDVFKPKRGINMRLISTERCVEGMIVAKAIYRANGTIIINSGMELKSRYLKKLKKIGINHIYIEDKSFNDLIVSDVVKEETRREAITCVNDVMGNLRNNHEVDFQGVHDMVEDIADQLLKKDDIIVSLAEIRAIDDYTFGHSVNVGILSMITGISMNYSRDTLLDLGLGAMLHDIGKTKISLKLLNKPGRLTTEEYEEVKKHTLRGHDILKDIDGFKKEVSAITLSHHERYDGKGYPYGLKNEEIPELARIVSVVDVYDALTNDRVYRRKISKHESLDYIISKSGEQFDPIVVNKFSRNISIFNIGEGVLLSTGEKGYILRINGNNPTKPLIRVLYDDNKKKLIRPYILDLSKEINIKIVDTVEIDADK